MENEERQTLVLVDERGETRGSTYRALHHTSSGRLIIEGHDLGPEVEEFWGLGEYEFERKLTAEETNRLRTLMELERDADLLEAIRHRFGSTPALESFLAEHDLEGEFWSRVGD